MLLESLRSEEKFGLTSIPEAVAEIIQQAIAKADKGEELLNTNDIINEIKLHREYEIEKFTFVKKLA